MSVINRMLQDLEKRQAKDQVNAAVSNQVRAAVPQVREAAIPWAWLAISLLTIICVALGYLYWKQIQPVPAKQVRQLPASPETARPLLKSETRLSTLQVPRENHSPAVAEGQAGNIAPLPSLEEVQPAATNKLLLAADQPKPKPAEAAAMQSPVKPQKTDPPLVATSSRPAPSANPDEVKNLKQITPEQVADNNYRHALTLLQQGRIAEAQAELESVLKQNPKHMGARQALLGVLVENRQTTAAIKLLQAGLALDPSRAEYAMALARLQVDANDNASALATMEKYLPQGAERADYQGFLALLLERANRHKEAAEHYLTALQMSPETAQWWMGLGISLQAAGDSRGAYQAYSRAKQLGTLSPELLTFIDQRIRQVQPRTP